MTSRLADTEKQLSERKQRSAEERSRFEREAEQVKVALEVSQGQRWRKTICDLYEYRNK